MGGEVGMRSILGWHIRSTVTEENVEKAMSYFALISFVLER